MTQHEKILNMCADGEWHCQNAFRELYIFSPHKRRSEIESKGKYVFEKRKCEHGVVGQFDYRMFEGVRVPPAGIVKDEKIIWRQDYLKSRKLQANKLI